MDFLMVRSRDNASSVRSRNHSGARDENRYILNVGDLEKSPIKNDILSTVTNVSTSHDAHSQLEKISKRLIGYSFNPLHSSLLTATSDAQHTPGTLTDTQAFYLFSAFNTLMNEYDNRGNAIQNLINQVSRNSTEHSADKEVTTCYYLFFRICKIEGMKTLNLYCAFKN
jgi:hypothetical protein